MGFNRILVVFAVGFNRILVVFAVGFNRILVVSAVGFNRIAVVLTLRRLLSGVGGKKRTFVDGWLRGSQDVFWSSFGVGLDFLWSATDSC